MSQNNGFGSLSIAVFTGNANPALAQEITRHLHVPLGRADVDRFSDGEVSVELRENVRGRDVFLLQPTHPPAENLMELLMMADACRRASAKRVTAVVPYFGYARQDRRPRATRVAITAKLVANMIARAGVDRLLVVDLHADQIQGFFRHTGGQRIRISGVARRGMEAEVREDDRGVAGCGRRSARASAGKAIR